MVESQLCYRDTVQNRHISSPLYRISMAKSKFVTRRDFTSCLSIETYNKLTKGITPNPYLD